MRKAYSAPNLYVESFEMNPIIGTDCADGVFHMIDVMAYERGNITWKELLGRIVVGSGETLILNHADSWDCHGAMFGEDIEGNFGMYTTFHTKNGGTSACDRAKLNALEDLVYPIQPYDQVCYNIPLFQLLSFS